MDDFIVLGNSQRLYDRFYQHYEKAVDGEIEEGDLDFMLGVNFDLVSIEHQRKWMANTRKLGAPHRALHILARTSNVRRSPLSFYIYEFGRCPYKAPYGNVVGVLTGVCSNAASLLISAPMARMPFVAYQRDHCPRARQGRVRGK